MPLSCTHSLCSPIVDLNLPLAPAFYVAGETIHAMLHAFRSKRIQTSSALLMPPPRKKLFKPRRFLCKQGTSIACRRGFVSTGGLTQHRNTAHPYLTHAQAAPRILNPLAQDPPAQDPLAQDPPPSPPPSPHDIRLSWKRSLMKAIFLNLRSSVIAGCTTRCLMVSSVVNSYIFRQGLALQLGIPINADENDLPPGMPPPPYAGAADPTSWTPFHDRPQFELADFLFPSQNPSEEPPFASHTDLYSTIDSIKFGEVPWQSFTVRYTGIFPNGEAPPWMLGNYNVWFRDPRVLLHNQLGNPDYKGSIDYAAVKVFDDDGQREWTGYMMGNWAWQQSDEIAKDDMTHGAMFVPVIVGSDKTTRSPCALRCCITRRIPRYPKEQYTNDATFRKFRRQLCHTSLTTIFGSLHPGMMTPEIVLCPDGHRRRVIYSLGPYIADYLKQVMLACIVSGWCPRCDAHSDNLDGGGVARSHGHTRLLMQTHDTKVLWNEYGIIDNVLPFTANFPRADIHQLITFDILHQVIKGTFKDHLVAWVGQYLAVVHSAADAAAIMADIDRRKLHFLILCTISDIQCLRYSIAAVPSFPGLRHFPEGRGFKQWTGDDLKVLMKVYLPAIVGHVPPEMVRAMSAFMEFCYLVRHAVINEATLDAIDDMLARFHASRVIFQQTGVRLNGFSLPRQHSLSHYRGLIEDFGAPNGLCSSITESKHIKAIKEPWCRSSHFNALGQMLVTNQRLDKLAACRGDFDVRGMLNSPCLPSDIQTYEIPVPIPPPPHYLADADQDALDGPRVQATVTLVKTKARGYPKHVHALATYLEYPELPGLIRCFLFDQLYPDTPLPASDIDITECPMFNGCIAVVHSAQAIFYSPSDLAGVGGMHQQCIRSLPSWWKGPPRRDCIFAEKDATLHVQYKPGWKASLIDQGETRPSASVLSFLRDDFKALGLTSQQPKSQNVFKANAGTPGTLELFWDTEHPIIISDSARLKMRKISHELLVSRNTMVPLAARIASTSTTLSASQSASQAVSGPSTTKNHVLTHTLPAKPSVDSIRLPSSSHTTPPASPDITHNLPPIPPPPTSAQTDLVASLRLELELSKTRLAEERAARERAVKDSHELEERCRMAEARERSLLSELRTRPTGPTVKSEPTEMGSLSVGVADANLRGELERLRATQATVLERLTRMGSSESQSDIMAALASVERRLSESASQLREAYKSIEAEIFSRRGAESQLKQEQTRHAQLMNDIERECKEPFVVPALLEAFVNLSQLTDMMVD
ncbi:hypothetical protein EW146_g5607 [Bondarzewia mesenterica]|uniref:C2H2-type domain-containing protein n=1 Tax=Bondarzewia mesenterica TaxID=1095465 RepID=A0A4S4LQZ3_9AGAM|nr:hypothetical protein EW146_g5607 [Bondarzewia mesenterica]